MMGKKRAQNFIDEETEPQIKQSKKRNQGATSRSLRSSSKKSKTKHLEHSLSSQDDLISKKNENAGAAVTIKEEMISTIKQEQEDSSDEENYASIRKNNEDLVVRFSGIKEEPEDSSDAVFNVPNEACSIGGSVIPDRALIQGYKFINEMAEENRFTKATIIRTQDLYKTVHNDKSLKGRSPGSIAAACLYLACKQEKTARTFKEICGASKISKKEIGRCYKAISKTLNHVIETTTADDFMNRWCCDELKLPPMVQEAASVIAKSAVDNDLVPGRSPISVAAAAIYMATQVSSHPKTQKEIAAAVGCADVTIRQSYKLMYPQAEDLFPKDFEFFTPIDQLPLA